MDIELIKDDLEKIIGILDGMTIILNSLHEDTSTVKNTAVFMSGVDDSLKDITRFMHRLSDMSTELKTKLSQQSLMIEMIDSRIKLIDERVVRSSSFQVKKDEPYKDDKRIPNK